MLYLVKVPGGGTRKFADLNITAKAVHQVLQSHVGTHCTPRSRATCLNPAQRLYALQPPALHSVGTLSSKKSGSTLVSLISQCRHIIGASLPGCQRAQSPENSLSPQTHTGQALQCSLEPWVLTKQGPVTPGRKEDL